MSLSQERPTNPSKFFLKIKSGKVNYYNKEEQANIDVPIPFEFIVLDQLATVKGWCDTDESGYWSNEVRAVGRDILTVRTSRGPKDSGIWREIKNNSSISGAKYSASVYIAHKSDNGFVISNLAITGASLNAWIEFTQKNKVNNISVTISDWLDAKKGSVAYKVPIFEAKPLTDEDKTQAVELDLQLQAYFHEYFNYTPDGDGHSVGVDDNTTGVELFGKVDEYEDKKKINLADIPF